MRTWSILLAFSISSVAIATALTPAQAQLWKKLIPVSHVEEIHPPSVTLTPDNGPWLIIAESFSGDAAEKQARDLADELRAAGLNAYVHDRPFDFSEKNPGRGLDEYGAPVRKRYQREADHQWAVLVGDFNSIEDPAAQATLERVKSMPSKVLAITEDDASGLDQMKQFTSNVVDKLGRRKERGPMAMAFFTRNPLLPREYFVPKGVDDFVASMNRDVEYSLLDCPGRYTVQIATFRGQTTLQTSTAREEDPASRFGFKWKKGKSDPLVEAAENAHLLTEELRKKGIEAYEFHNRTESTVCVGAFEQVALRGVNGQPVPSPEVQQIIVKFGAAYDTPADPLTGDDIRRTRQAEEMKNQFTQMLSNHDGQVASGLNPKHVKIMRGKRVERIIPIDIYPTAIEVPRRSISGAYAGQR
jgi:hypothetical protein